MSVNSQPMFNTLMFNDLPFYTSFQACGQLGTMSGLHEEPVALVI